MLWRVPIRPPKRQILTFVLENWEKSTVKLFIGICTLNNFVNLFIIFCPRLQYEATVQIFGTALAKKKFLNIIILEKL